jgi:hypothetical protein
MEDCTMSKGGHEVKQLAPSDKSRALTYPTGILRGPDLRKNFGLNVECCLKIIGSNLDSLALRTVISKVVLVGFKLGNAEVTDERVEAIACDLDVKPTDLLMEYKTPDARESAFRSIFVSKKRITNGDGLIGGNVSRSVPIVPEAEVLSVPTIHPEVVQPVQSELAVVANEAGEELSVLEDDHAGNGDTSDADDEETATSIENTQPVLLLEHSEVEPVMNTDTNEVTWDGDDLVATIGEHKVKLRDKNVREKVMGRVREAVDAKDMTFTELIEKAKLGKPSSWFRGVETAQSRIYGTQVESIAEVCGTTVEYLLTGKKSDSVEADDEVEPEHVELPVCEAEQPATSVLSVAAPVIPEKPTQLLQNEGHDYFRDRFLSDTTVPASGISVGQLLKQASGNGTLDWATAFFTLTEEGVELRSNMDKLVTDFTAHPIEIQDVLFHMLTGAEEE